MGQLFISQAASAQIREGQTLEAFLFPPECSMLCADPPNPCAVQRHVPGLRGAEASPKQVTAPVLEPRETDGPTNPRVNMNNARGLLNNASIH